jgi:hypothetical protein
MELTTTFENETQNYRYLNGSMEEANVFGGFDRL